MSISLRQVQVKSENISRPDESYSPNGQGYCQVKLAVDAKAELEFIYKSANRSKIMKQDHGQKQAEGQATCEHLSIDKGKDM